MNNDQSMKSGARTLVFFSDFTADMGLKSILKNRSLSVSRRSGQECYDRGRGYQTEQHAMPIHELINYMLKLNRTQPENKIIVLTETNDHALLKLLASFNLFYLLSKKESLQFIHQTVAESTDVSEQNASPDIINRIGGRCGKELITHRQWFILNQLAKSLSPAVIGGIWGLHVKTISTHKMNIMKKLGLTPWQFTQLLMMLGEVREISTIGIREISTIGIKASSYHDVKSEVIATECDRSFTVA